MLFAGEKHDFFELLKARIKKNTLIQTIQTNLLLLTYDNYYDFKKYTMTFLQISPKCVAMNYRYKSGRIIVFIFLTALSAGLIFKYFPNILSSMLSKRILNTESCFGIAVKIFKRNKI